MSCHNDALPRLLEESRPPDADLVDLIEWAFLEGQIDGEAMQLASLWRKSHAVSRNDSF